MTARGHTSLVCPQCKEPIAVIESCLPTAIVFQEGKA